ncbi:MAG: tRNA lysidine(34) synthetase TilS [Cyanobacteria bacterium SBLK]|nr:tRNA lysidine(34) synthetase TilS [Cyanobacteria bacterium SBLK]
MKSWTLLHDRIHKTLRKRRLAAKGDRLLVAVSGGQDSLCLLKLLLDLQPKWQWQLAVAHCDHDWATDAGIADRVTEIARSWDLPLHLKRAQGLPETEAAAREWRYRSLAEIAAEQDFSCIAVGHTQSDRAETLLYNLIRGAGADGLQALTWHRCLTPNIRLIRPLLEVTRSQTGEFCQEFQLPVWEDIVNDDLRYARNRLRAEIIPYLKEYLNPRVERNLAQTSELLRAEVEYLEAEAAKYLERALVVAENPALDRQILRSLPLALQRRSLRQFLRSSLPSSPVFEQIEAAIYLLSAPNKSKTSTFPGGVYLEVRGDLLILRRSPSVR